MANKVERESDRGWIAGAVLVCLATLSLVLGLAVPPPSAVGSHARSGGSPERHATAVPQSHLGP